MSELINSSDDECWINNWEEQTISAIEDEPDQYERLNLETTQFNTKQWTLFQSAAQCVAIMYRGSGDNHHSMWVPFQTAAGNITTLYKDSIEQIKRNNDIAMSAGYQKRTKELVNWARKRRHIRREDLLAFLAGKNPPPHPRNSHLRSSPRTRLPMDRMSPRLPSPHLHHLNHPEPDLSTFKQALGLPGSESILVRPPPLGSPNLSRRRSSAHLPELQSFLCDEFTRHKRPAPAASPNDVNMDSPQHKRSRFT